MTRTIPYNEYKFLVSNEKLGYVRDVLEALYGHTDPYPQGIVDSVYYDSFDRSAYDQCLNGEPTKIKYRIRGYGDGQFSQLQRKEKDMFGVRKIKSRLEPIEMSGLLAPRWDSLRPLSADDQGFKAINALASSLGPLVPAIRVRYKRYRYRVNDYRITLDTEIEVSGFDQFKALALHYAVIPHHVLEVKTLDPRPHLPLLGLARLPQISFSKFFLGLNLLEAGSL